MVQSKLFCSGIELASFVTSSNILCNSWRTIISSDNYEDGDGLSWKLDTEPGSDFTILAFKATSDDSSNVQPDLISSAELKEDNFLNFEFSSNRTPNFSLNKAAVLLFRKNHQELDRLKSEITSLTNRSTPLIFTGHGLGGSIASLFVLSLLQNVGSGKNRPLCITFGSPLVGDKRLQQAISCSPIWNSCFIHVVSHIDPLPRLFITNRTSTYMPFGTFIICSSDATSFENPKSILEILVAFASDHDDNQELEPIKYGDIVRNLYEAACIDFYTQAENMTNPDSLATGISLQLRALQLTPHMQQQENNNINTLEAKIKKLEERFVLQQRTQRINNDPSKILNDMKMFMAQLELYKKETKNQQIGYYDSYKTISPLMISDSTICKELSDYWQKMVEEAKMKPQKEGAALRTRWLQSGNTYRRMVEPLAIANYYSKGGKDYVNNRSEHFKQLEEWLMEVPSLATSNINNTRRKDVQVILTTDSCFWARVEEALLLCKEFNVVVEKEDSLKKLLEFEEYVYKLLKDYDVSPDIFLEQSSYIRWWNEYKEIKRSSDPSALENFMNDDTNIKQYATGAYDFP